jgi:hypothetical protein
MAFPQANFRGAVLVPETRWLRAFLPATTERNGRKRMTKMRAAFMMLAVVIAAIPAVLYAQSEPTQTTTGSFTIAPDANSGGVWRLNANTGELWFCLASGTPQCHLAVNAKK